MLAAEKMDNTSWAQLFQDRGWGKMGARGPMLHNLTPDGTAVAHGLLSTTLEDFARFGMRFTPSWKEAAFEPVVSAQVLSVFRPAATPQHSKQARSIRG